MFGTYFDKKQLVSGWCGQKQKETSCLKNELGDNFIPAQCDVSCSNQVKIVSDRIKKEHIIPSHFFLCAGIREPEKTGFTLDIEQRTFAINYFGAMAWVQEWVPTCLKRGEGVFVGISSGLILLPTPLGTAYCASKAALKSAFASLRTCHANSKLSFVTVVPGAINTPMLRLKNKNLAFVKEPMEVAEYIIKKTLEKNTIIVIPRLDKLLLLIISLLPSRVIKRFFDKHFDF